MVHQHFMLVPVFTVAENIVLGHEKSGFAGVLNLDEARERIKRVSDQFNFDVNPDDLIEGLPVGVQQRVEIIRALIYDAKVLILDEPTRGLDYQTKSLLVSQLTARAKDSAAVIIATHDVELVAELANRIVILADGELVADGPAIDVLLSSPAFAPQVTKVMSPRRWLTVNDVINSLDQE